jgi:dynein heavy chain 2
VYARPRWESALQELDKTLAPVEVHASTALKNRLYLLADNPELLMQEFGTFGALLRRQNISQALENERKTLLQQLMTRVEELRTNFEQYSSEYSSSGSKAPPQLKNQPSVFLSKIIWSNQLSHRVQQIVSIVRNILHGIIGQEKFLALASDLRKRVDAFAKDLFDRWHSEILSNLNDASSTIRLETSGKLMDLDLTGSGELVIHYSENLVTLLREVRQLQEYGYKIQDAIVKAVATGEKYYKYGLKLKQVANFYNTIKEKIIPSQMGMLLLEAQKFERAIKDQKGTKVGRCTRTRMSTLA